MNTTFNEETLLEQAIEHHKRGEYEKAKKIYHLIIHINDKHFDALQLLALAEFQTKNYERSIAIYEKAIIINSKNPAVMNAMGLAYEASNRFDDAIKAFDCALKINSKELDALNNKANLFKKIGRTQEANAIYKHAYEINPNSIVTNYNYGNYLLDLNKYNEAINHYQIALKNKLNDGRLYNNLCIAYTGINEQGKALEYGAVAISSQPNNKYYLENFKNAMAMRGNLQEHLSENVRKVIEEIVDNLTMRPETIVNLLIHVAQIESYYDLFPIENKHNTSDETVILKIKSLSENKLFLKLLTLCPISNIKLESLIINLRSYILFNHQKLPDEIRILNLILSISIQNYMNEYIYPETKTEREEIYIIEKKLRSHTCKNANEETVLTLILSMYQELERDLIPSNFHQNKYLTSIHTLHIENKETETTTKEKFKSLTDITDEISVLSKMQYEESPYPRWFYLNIPPAKMSFKEYLNNLQLQISNNDILSKSNLTVLVAGCGTGRSTIELSKNFQNVNITAIDLSSKSLAYADRMSKQFNISNITFKQCDILNAYSLGQYFDVINADGVLHHLGDPIHGLKSLINILNPGGFIKIGLYSEIARRDINLCRDEIQRLGLTNSLQDIKKYRNNCATSELPYHRGIRSFSDFYSRSEFRDLVFHVKEHQFSWSKIRDMLLNCNLSFCGFSSLQITNKFSAEDDIAKTDFKYLSDYEEQNPNTFKEMYQFWCQKL